MSEQKAPVQGSRHALRLVRGEATGANCCPGGAGAGDGSATDDAAAQIARGATLSPAARVLWRGAQTVQLEIGSRAVILDGIDPGLIRLLAGRTRTADTLAGSTGAGLPPETAERLVADGYLWPGAASSVQAGARVRPPIPRLAAELGSLTARHGTAAVQRLQARREAAVAISGTGRIAAPVAALLAAAGVGRLHLVDTEPVTLRQVMPGGLLPADEGRPFAAAVADAVRRVAPDTDLTPLPIGHRPDLVILACDEPVDSERRESLHARRCTHLVVRLNDDTGVVGPMVIPGASSCLRCADLHRRDRDPAWGALAAQLTVPHRYGPTSDVTVATVMAGIAAREALAYLDAEEPASIDATLELHLPDWRIRRRAWSSHDQCGCGADAAT